MGQKASAKLPRRAREVPAVVFILPAGVLLFAFWVLPTLLLLGMSWLPWQGSGVSSLEPTLENYRAVLSDAGFWRSALNTGYLALGTVPVSVAIALLLAIMVSGRIRGEGFFQGAIFSPTVTSLVASGIVWVWLMDYDRGFVNHLLNLAGIGPVAWLESPRAAMPAVIIMSLWRTIGYNMVIFVAGLKSIPAEYYEAALLNGAREGIGTFRYVTWPLLRKTTSFVVVISTIFALRSFEQVYVMTKGGPLGATKVLVYYIYEEAFELFHLGKASAAALVVLVMIVAVTLIQFSLLERKGHEV